MSTPDLGRGRWRRSSRSDNGGGNCVEIARVANLAAIRDSKDPDGRVLIVDQLAWERLRSAIG